jgi:hypothetical protein
MPSASYTGWHHIVAVGSGATTAFYVDGVYRGSADFKSGDDIHAIGNASAGTQQFADRIDEFAAWTRALSATEIGDIYTKQVNLPLTPDSSGNSNNLITYGTPTYVTGLIGARAIDFNGTDQRVDGTISGGPAANGTICGWLRLNTTPTDYDPMFGLAASTAGVARAFLIKSSRLYFMGYAQDEADVSDTLTVGTWYHVAMTWTSTTNMVVYLDGVAYKTWTEAGLVAPTNNFFIAKRPGSSGSETYYSDISVDEVAIWSRTLSAAEITALYALQTQIYVSETNSLTFTPDVAGAYTVRLEVYPGVYKFAQASIGTPGGRSRRRRRKAQRGGRGFFTTNINSASDTGFD